MKKMILPLVLLSSLMVISGCKKEQVPTFEDFEDSYEEALPTNSEDGVTFHAFCWTFNQIKENLPALASAGFKNILTMPVQQPKGGGSSWWAYYQPISFSIADNSSLGSKDDLRSLCQEAETYNISIMVDVVANHMANISDDDLESDGTPCVSPTVATYEPVLYNNRNQDTDGKGITFHHNPTAASSGEDTQYYAYGKLPDLNTGNAYVQGRVLSLLKECIDVGVDGFRFDAARHIETEDDPAYASNFWVNTLDVAKTYYTEQTGKELYVYGEILNSPVGRSVDVYTKRMRVTDDGYLGTWLSSFDKKNPSGIISKSYTKSSDPTKLMTYVESHDTYIDATTPIKEKRLNRLWAILASRKDLGCLFLGRPDSNVTVGNIGSYNFESESVACVNRFHNRFVGASENLSASDTVFVNERISDTDQGALLVNTDATMANPVTVALPNLEEGNYYDQVTGEKVVVYNHKAKVNFAASSIAVLTRTNDKVHPTYTVSERSGGFVENKYVTVTLSNYEEGKYWFNNEETTYPLGDSTKIALKDHVTSDNKVTLHIEAKNGEHILRRDFTYSKYTLIEGYFNVFNVNPTYLTDYELYMWSWSPNLWSKNYTVQDGVLLVDTTGMTGFLLAIFTKGYVVTSTGAWDSTVIKQSADIKGDDLKKGYYDLSSF